MRSLFLGFALSVIAFGVVFQAQANPVTDIVESAANPANYFVFGQFQTYYELIDQLENKRIELEVLTKGNQYQEAQIQSTSEALGLATNQISALEKNITALQNQADKSEAEQEKLTGLKVEKVNFEEQKGTLSQELKTLETEFNQNQTTKLNGLQSDITDLEEALNQSQIKIKTYAEGFIKKAIFAISILLFSVFAKWIIVKIFNRLDFYFTPHRKAFILQLIRLTINGLTVLGILLVFFSQLIQALPYFAIFATALAFAMRDVILSVIAWIIIGTKDGYKVGQYLHIGNLWGTVVDINPFNTIVRQGGMSGQTGRLLTFPNKMIFEAFLENWSRLFNYTYLKWDFFLEQGSDIERAEALLLEILASEQAKFKDSLMQKKVQFIKKGLSEEDLHPRIFWEIQANGILLRGKLLVNFDDFFCIRSAVTREFIIAINKEKNIHLRFVNNLLPNTL